jgi:hypothetical protein
MIIQWQEPEKRRSASISLATPICILPALTFSCQEAISFAWGELGVRVLGRRSVEATQSGEVELFVPVPVSLFKILEKFNKFEC